MKYSLLILVSLVALGCKQQSAKKDLSKIDTGENTANLAKYEHKLDSIGKDSINISADPEMPIFYKVTELKDFIKNRPELISEYTEEPSIEYAKKKLNPDELNGHDGPDYSFSSEVGQDDYYSLYAYFLRFRNGDKPFATQRIKLIKLYGNINSIFEKLNGGTYFGHQETRILGDAEYAVSLYPKNKDDYYVKTYNIAAQKRLYIGALKQRIDDELSANTDIPGKDKPATKVSLYKTVNDIDGLITEYFYLTMAQQFQYTNY
ncbi:hypothetical protein [Mucilaginibacter flavidus]|uniref:hypothetical protein n=1 Tax=Mucilaginibacter flavidus TaxID=2949309 RepID=UPI0020932527|nr:hypothetical protein [Mucilaginibacter flavidus]MCO5947805.1 hypothetical protein [Mucilaginibacter flavidus]